MQISEIIKGDVYILCICEGKAEEDIMNMLLDHDMLIFDRSDLIDHKVVKRSSVQSIQEKYLSISYGKPVYILRIIDSRTEAFKLSKVYEERYGNKILNLLTRPEIEILIIIKNGDFDTYTRKYKSRIKPSQYCKDQYRIAKIKSSGTMNSIFKDMEDLKKALRTYHKYKSDNEYSIYDLLK
ncbi:MAG: hypothetical protein EOM07_09230 [Clostridia bacterium]|nr:hypothetical protein [Clostridia bacterium]